MQPEAIEFGAFLKSYIARRGEQQLAKSGDAINPKAVGMDVPKCMERNLRSEHLIGEEATTKARSPFVDGLRFTR